MAAASPATAEALREPACPPLRAAMIRVLVEGLKNSETVDFTAATVVVD
jgi:hypothetical protein